MNDRDSIFVAVMAVYLWYLIVLSICVVAFFATLIWTIEKLI